MPAILSHQNLRSQFSTILAGLMPWRCGRLREHTTPATSDLLFTKDEVAWHEFDGTGMYTIINGGVYDLTSRFLYFKGQNTTLTMGRLCQRSSRRFPDSRRVWRP